MFGQKKKLIVKREDMDQAILAKNQSLKKFNIKLINEIKSKKTEIKDHQEEIKKIQSVYTKEDKAVKSISKEILRLNSTLAPIQQEQNLLSNDIAVLKEEVKARQKDKADILQDICELDKECKSKVSTLSKIKDEMSVYKASKSNIAATNKELKKAKEDLLSVQGQYKNAEDKLNIRIDNHELIIKGLDKDEAELTQSFKVIEKDFKVKKTNIEVRSKELSKQDQELSSQVNGLNTLIGQEESKYKTLSIACDEKNDDIKRAEFQADKIIQEAKDSASEIRGNFKMWKLNVLAEVAKLQLKGKIDFIDKAGLAEILNG